MARRPPIPPYPRAHHPLPLHANQRAACILPVNRFIINDTYRSELCLLYPPHMIAIAAIYLTLVLNDKTRDAIQAQKQKRRLTPKTPFLEV